MKSLADPQKHLYLCLTEEFLSNCMESISTNIRKEFQPIIEYLEELDKKFVKIYPDLCSETFLKSLTDMDFEDGCTKMSYYKNYIQMVQFIPNFEYFPGGRLELISYREKLHVALKTITENIFNKMRSKHYWETTDICESFQLINMRALKKAETTEELIETGKFMAFVKDEYFQSLIDRVHASLELLSKIIMLGFLSKEHMKTNAAAINWLDQIPPVIEHHSTVYEQMKFEAEEKLQKIIEDVNVAIKEVFPSLVMLDDMDNIENVKSYLHSIIGYMTKIKNIEQQISWINQEEVCLSFPKSTYSEYENLKNYVYPFYHLLKVCLDIQRNLSVWQDGQFDHLDYDTTNNLVEKYYKELIQTQKDYRKKLRQAQDDNLPVRFKGTVDDPDILNWPAPLKLCVKAIKMIEDFKPSLRIMKIMCNKSLKKRHWIAMSEIASFDMTPNAGTTLRKIMKYDLDANLDKYEIISNGAMKEQLLSQNLDELNEQWENISIQTTEVNGKTIFVQLPEIAEIVDDHLIKVSNMKSSVFVQPFEKQVEEFHVNLLNINHFLSIWTVFQAEWMKLAPIFEIETISFNLKKENELFQHLDEVFDKYVNLVKKNPVVLHLICKTNVIRDVETCLGTLEVINKGVTKYLENIRSYFPRFYFLPDEALIRILSQSKYPKQIEYCLRKLFRSIYELNINEDDCILAMISKDKETVPFHTPVDIKEANGDVEKWLKETENQMVVTLKSMLIECRKYCKKDTFMQLFQRWPQQIMELHLQILFTEAVDNALSSRSKIRLRLLLKKTESGFKEKLELLNHGELTNFERDKVHNMLITDMNNKSIIKLLLENNVIDLDNFNWEVQLKYYHQSERCFVRTLKCTINYLFEYQGNLNQIIMTPLTDRCFRSLINSNCLHLNALMQGSAETGKTETVKSLSKAFAVLIITFNCSECLNYQTIQRFLKGSAICGSWLCIKKVNLVQSEVLSIIYQDLLAILTSIKNKLHKASFEGELINVSPTCFVCMTVDINKSTRNFPENFKLLFRYVTMTTPDLKIITEVGLYSRGFLQASELSKKINTSFKILKDFLKTENSQNFGLESIKLLLRVCGEFKVKHPQHDETGIVANSIKQLIHPRLTDKEIIMFNSILSDMFPGTTPLSEGNAHVKSTVENYCKEFKLIPNDLLCLKTSELHASLQRKHGVVITGDTSAGKTTILKICSRLYDKLSLNIINPKTFNYQQLFGTFDPISRIWTDGLVTKLLTECLQDSNTRWICFDGNIDSSWIDNINNLLESEKVYYLSSGEKLLLDERLSILFEVKDLRTASPSTVRSLTNLIYVLYTFLIYRFLIAVLSTWTHQQYRGNTYWSRSCQLVKVIVYKPTSNT